MQVEHIKYFLHLFFEIFYLFNIFINKKTTLKVKRSRVLISLINIKTYTQTHIQYIKKRNIRKLNSCLPSVLQLFSKIFKIIIKYSRVIDNLFLKINFHKIIILLIITVFLLCFILLRVNFLCLLISIPLVPIPLLLN